MSGVLYKCDGVAFRDAQDRPVSLVSPLDVRDANDRIIHESLVD